LLRKPQAAQQSWVISEGENLFDWTVDDAFAYWRTDDKIFRAPLKGGATTTLGKLPGELRAMAASRGEAFVLVDLPDEPHGAPQLFHLRADSAPAPVQVQGSISKLVHLVVADGDRLYLINDAGQAVSVPRTGGAEQMVCKTPDDVTIDLVGPVLIVTPTDIVVKVRDYRAGDGKASAVGLFHSGRVGLFRCGRDGQRAEMVVTEDSEVILDVVSDGRSVYWNEDLNGAEASSRSTSKPTRGKCCSRAPICAGWCSPTTPCSSKPGRI
jgi:hypothetical protein